MIVGRVSQLNIGSVRPDFGVDGLPRLGMQPYFVRPFDFLPNDALDLLIIQIRWRYIGGNGGANGVFFALLLNFDVGTVAPNAHFSA